MLSEAQKDFLKATAMAAKDGAHIYPGMAACEAALESAWGTSELAIKAHNLFGQKQQVHPVYGSIEIPTREFIHHQWVTQDAEWVEFPAISTCFASRMATLMRLAADYPHYAMALEAKTPEDYVTEVSLSWSTDPQRAEKCIAVFHAHRDILSQ